MIDLERVRNDLAFRCACPWKPAEGLLQYRPHTKSCGAAIIHAHLEEDAEREATWQARLAHADTQGQRIEALQDELARLRASAKGHAQCERNMDAEIDRLREDYAVLNQEADALSKKVVTLLEALRDHWDHDETWCFACHQPLEQCSARQLIEGKP